MSLRTRVLWALPTLLAAGLFAGLGFWQAGRADQKERMAQLREDARAAGPMELARALDSPEALLPLAVHGEVRLRPAPVLLLDNQQRDGRVGVRAYALAEVSGGRVLVVELGWLPLAADRVLPEVAVPTAPRSLAGLLAPWPGQGLRLAENAWTADAQGRVLLAFLAREDVAHHLGVEVWNGLLQPDPSEPFGYARDPGLRPDPMPPERHRGYAVQWWGLSLTVIITYLILNLRRKNR